MLESLTVTPTAIIIMALVGLFTLVLPLGLGIFFWQKSKGRWRFFLIGCIIFPVFVLILERTAHSLLLYGAPGAVLQGNIWLYAFYAGLMAGVFEECGRWLAFKLSLRWSRGPGDALMYGAGHGGIEAILLAGMTMLSNITLALALNRGGLEAVEAMMGPLSETGLAAIQGLCANPAGIYFWTGFERLVAVGLHIALSVLVYVSVRRRDNWFWFPAAILLHTLVDMVTILANAWLPIAATEVIAALLTLGSIALARKVYIEEKEDSLPPFSGLHP